MMLKESSRKLLDALAERQPKLRACLPELAAACEMIGDAFRAGQRLYLCGNGGSMADCQHIAGELLKSFVCRRALPPAEAAAFEAAYGEAGKALAATLQGALPVQTLGCEPAFLTAFGNDCDPVYALAQQAWTLLRAGDVLLCISTSGNSANCIHAARAAHIRGAKVLLLTGSTGGRLAALSDGCIRVPATEPYLVQEFHLPVYHTLCLMLENEFFAD